MAITFRAGEGSRTTTRAITSITGGVIVLGTALTTPAVGDVLEILSSSTIANNTIGYTITALAGNNPTVRPLPIDQGASGSAVRLNRATARTLGATAVTSVLALGATGLAVVEVVGANFVTNSVGVCDRLALSGSAIAANNGGWYISEVLSESRVVVRPPDGGAGMTTEAVGTGNIGVRHGVHVVNVLNEASPSWQRFLDVATPQAGPTGFMGSGASRDYARKTLVGGVNTSPFVRTLFELHGLSIVNIDQSGLGAPSEWVAENEIAVNMRTGGPGTTGDLLSTIRFTPVGSWGVGNVLSWRLGNQLGDRYSAQDGSVWLGCDWLAAGFSGTQRFRVSLFGSYVDAVNRNVELGPGGDVTGSIIRPTAIVNDGLIETLTAYGLGALVTQAGGDQANILIAQQTSGASFLQAATISGLQLSDQVIATGFLNFSGATIVILDPLSDLDLSVNFTNFSGEVEKHYTFNPRFVTNQLADDAPTVLVGLSVTIVEIDEVALTETTVFTGVTGAGGTISGGAGAALRRQLLASDNSTSLFSHRITVSGAGLPSISEMIQMRREEVGDYSVGTAVGMSIGQIVSVVGEPPRVAVVTQPAYTAVVRPESIVVEVG